ncbi:putative 7-carboxy-7-deazaguanine synthase QueE [Fusobacterium necrophorum]|uniref:putative 7-carboxy-7-deazaguanine synthase QueE n=1 Tax=Fusobacterium necrophorum TaxID=859 RepID=UPI00370EAF31
MPKYKVVEMFESINGEGKKAGQLALFIRFQFCNLNCSYCDTKWANTKKSPFTWMSLEEILETARQRGIKNITLTGGEPLLQSHIFALLEAFSKEKMFEVEIETNGSIPLKKFQSIENSPSFTLDYKLPQSNMEEYMCLENFSSVSAKDTIKFVVSDLQDLERSREIMNKYSLIGKCSLYLSPVFGKIPLPSIVDFMKKYHLNGVNMQLQMHKFIWDPETKGV